jgi:hypothetical protein
VVALNNSERYYTAFTLVLATAVVCIAVLSRGGGQAAAGKQPCRVVTDRLAAREVED